MSADHPYDEAVIDAVNKVLPSVVTISTVQVVEELFRAHPIQGMGSGVVVHPEGYIATNNHVVANSRQLTIMTTDGRKLQGRVVGVDPSSDVAVVKVDEKGLPVAEVADSEELRIGQTVVAIGNPFGFFLGGPTVTRGVVSAAHRDISLEENIFEDLIQTDAAINPGNSGGPLIDLHGHVVGLNTAMIPYAQGIGFAIPASTVRKAVEDLILYGKVTRTWLGIAGFSVDRNVAEHYRLPVEEGVAVAGVAKGGPAFRAGVNPGDIITSLDSSQIRTIKDLRKYIRSRKPGDELQIELLRSGKRYTMKAVLSQE
ncbi:MAG TPA: trypsin-like peptidase domain-containing protein [Conexivisphaerales archaeon]|nr:trypsin-like peptidase domain-containing protein [Conexivisphaerales archaeon]